MSVNNDISSRNNNNVRHANESQADDEPIAIIDTSSTTQLDTYFSDAKVIIPSSDNNVSFKFINILIEICEVFDLSISK